MNTTDSTRTALDVIDDLNASLGRARAIAGLINASQGKNLGEDDIPRAADIIYDNIEAAEELVEELHALCRKLQTGAAS